MMPNIATKLPFSKKVLKKKFLSILHQVGFEKKTTLFYKIELEWLSTLKQYAPGSHWHWHFPVFGHLSA